MTVAAAVLYVASLLLFLPAVVAFVRRRWDLFWGFGAVSNGLGTIGDCLSASWGWAASGTVVTLLCIWFWHDERRKRGKRKVTEMLGEKSKALRDALVRKARLAARPSPVLRPSLRGAP